MDSDQGKLFIGGISWETDEQKLKDYFGNYGEVLLTSVMKDKITGKPRGFGFVVFADPSVLDTVLQEKHVIDGRMVEPKRAMSREEQQVSKVGNPSSGRSYGGGDVRTKKIFVGGLPPTLSEDEFRQYFESYGQVTDVVVMYDQQTNRPRGFGFISFDTEDAVDRVLHKTFHDLNGKQVEVKRALPRDSNAGGGGGRGMGGGASRGGGGYPSYGASGGNLSSYEGRDSSRYMQSQNTGSGYPSYGSSGYGASNNWYGPGGNGAGSGGYGSYGGANPGYGGPTGGPYGNPNVPNTGYGSYGSGPAGASRNAYGAHASSGYGNTQWGASGGSNGGPGGAPVSAPTGQSPSGSTAYGNQGYGYGGYGGADGSYGNPAAYGAVGGRPGGAPNSGLSAGGDVQSSGGGYMGGNYGDPTGNSGYGNQGWRSEPAQGAGSYGAPNAGLAGYGGGYGAQQQ
ncbi:heterogeneous nuclear ribonucleoprotein 1-like [Apium graveolens]|uniref:heterogeneous nuclear ribonucleoprotein 1-like n=1 Tax=Apium graveolens TaxID=4045 RepID=UPI003D7901EE